MSYLIRRVLAKLRLILDEMCRLYGKFASYLRRVLCKTRLIFPRINGPIMTIKQCLRLSEVQEKHGILPWYGGSFISHQNKSRPTRLLENSCVTFQKQLVAHG